MHRYKISIISTNEYIYLYPYKHNNGLVTEVVLKCYFKHW